mgnify:CR=1 FL=1
MPERTDEQGDTVWLKETGEFTEEGCVKDQHLSLSEMSESRDSLDEARVGNRSAEHVGLVLSSDTLFAKQPELTSARPEVS